MKIDPVLPSLDLAHAEAPDLHQLIDSTRDRGPVVPVRYHDAIAYLVTGYDEVRAAFGDEENFESAAFYRIHAEPSQGRTLQSMIGKEHKTNRALVSRAFLPRQVEDYVEGLITEEALRRIEIFAGSTEVDLVESFTRPFPFSVITRLLGLPIQDEPQFLGWALKLIDHPWDPEGALRARREFTDYLQPVLNAARADRCEGLLSTLAHAEIDGSRLEDEEIFAFCRQLFPAGSDTAFKNLGSLLTAILTTPGMRELACGSDSDRADLVQEGLRWEAPVALQPRACSRDTVLGGVEIAAGSAMLFGVTAANHDAKIFEDPHRFDPSRPNKHQHLAFGYGEHFCLGSHLARRELERALKLLFERFPHMALVPGSRTEILGCVIRGPAELHVRLAGHN
ncbi:MAG: cytochrome P450 [bacterium]|nr:cytochrome P450 [Deltaproteobacteria bacterium]MCP4905402.1 cytochrome P450 [bacterium]